MLNLPEKVFDAVNIAVNISVCYENSASQTVPQTTSKEYSNQRRINVLAPT